MLELFKGLATILDPAVKTEALGQRVGKSWNDTMGGLGIALVSLIVAFVCELSLFGIQWSRPEPVFNTWNPKQGGQTLVVDDTPVTSTEKIKAWSEEALKETFSFNFSNIDDRLEEASGYFTEDGWSAFSEAMAHSKVRDTVLKQRLEVSLTPLGDARIVNRGGWGPFTVWQVEVPVVLAYTGASPPVPQHQLIKLILLQVPTTQSPNGLQISQFNVSAIQ